MEIKKVALGKDITISFPVSLDGEAQSLEGKLTEVSMLDYNGNAYTAAHSINGNVVTASYPGIEQKLLGVYAVRLWLNKGHAGQNMLDIGNAFELVATTEEENVEYQDTARNILIKADNMSVNALPNAEAYFDGEGVVINTLQDLQ